MFLGIWSYLVLSPLNTAHSCIAGWGTTLQASRWCIWFPMKSMNFSIDIILQATLMALWSTQPLTKMSTRNLPGDKQRPSVQSWQPHRHLWTECLENVGTSTSHNPMGLHGLLKITLALLPNILWTIYISRKPSSSSSSSNKPNI
jgi:hypothetical protein